MSKVSITRSLLDDLAMSISAKSGEAVPMTLAEMKDAVDGIQTGGGTSWQTLYDGSVQVYSSSPNYFRISPYTTAFQADQTYRVTWNQTQYLCNTIADPLGATHDGYLIGNLGIVGAGTDTGEPFIIYRNSATELTGGTSSSTGTYSLKIELQQSGINLQTKTKTYTPTTSQQTESVTADNGYDGLDTVSITVSPVSQTNLTAANIKNGTTVTISNGTSNLWSVTGTYEGGGGSSTCKTTTMTNSNDQATSIEFTELSGEPKWFFVRLTSQLTRSSSYSYYYVTAVRYNGTNHNGNYYRRSNGTYYNDTTHYSHTYSNGTLTVSSSASRGAAGGSFYNGGYELVYIY